MRGAKAALLVLCLIAAGGWWWWINSPIYAVQQAAGAVKMHDAASFHNWVDVPSVSSNAVDDLLSEPLRGTGSELLERIVGLAVLTVFKPAIVDGVDNQIDKWIEYKPHAQPSSGNPMNDAAQSADGNTDDDDAQSPPKGLLGTLIAIIKPPSLKEIFKENGLTKQNYRGIGSTDTANHLAHVGLKFFSPKTQRDYEIKLELSDASGRWQVMRIANLPEIVFILNSH
jgi:hypothetical protein